MKTHFYSATLVVSGFALALSGCGLGGTSDLGDDRSPVDPDYDATAAGGSGSGAMGATGGLRTSAADSGTSKPSQGGNGSCLPAVCEEGSTWSQVACACVDAAPADAGSCQTVARCPDGWGWSTEKCACECRSVARCLEGTTWSMESCQCEPDEAAPPADAGTCQSVARCPDEKFWSTETCACECKAEGLCEVGSAWSTETCQCEPVVASAPCSEDADCVLHADYCTGCDCRSLVVGAELPLCPHEPVNCFADPCQFVAAVCEDGQCATNDL